MRRLELMVEMLEEMSDTREGCIVVLNINDSESDIERRHHADLLDDTGLAVWKSDSIIRITSQGYDFLNIVKTDKPKYLKKGKQLLDQGASILNVVNSLVSIANNVQI